MLAQIDHFEVNNDDFSGSRNSLEELTSNINILNLEDIYKKAVDNILSKH